MDLPPHGWDREEDGEEEEEEGEDEDDEDEEEEEECSEQQGKGYNVESRIPGVGTWRPGGCSRCAASCGKHDDKGTWQHATLDTFTQRSNLWINSSERL